MPAVQTSALAAPDWELTPEPDPRPGCLIVQGRTRALVVPWFRFVYAEGDNALIHIAFASHDVTVTGHGLVVLLAAISTQRVVRIIEPTENEVKFGVRGNPSVTHAGPAVTGIKVQLST